MNERHDSTDVHTATNLLNSITFQFVVTLMCLEQTSTNQCNFTASSEQTKNDVFRLLSLMIEQRLKSGEYRMDNSVQKILNEVRYSCRMLAIGTMC